MAEIAPGSEETQTQMQLDQATTYAKSLTATIARAIRLRAAGQDLNASEVRRQAHQTYEQLLALLPAEQEPEPVTFSPLDLMQRYWESQAQRKERAATGFPALNRALSGGLERDRLYVLLGAPGSGKTTLVNQVCDHLGRERAVFYVTSENAPMDLLVKTIARRASIEYTAVARGYSSERDRINAAFEEYRQQPMAHHLRYADATQAGIPLAEIASLAYDHFEASQASTRGDPVLVIDYLQRLARAEDRALRQAGSLGLGNDARQIATVYTERLRELACQLHCSVICLSAVSRSNGYTANTNMLGAAKESGDIEYTADVVMGLGPDEPGGNPFALPEPGAYAWILRLDKNRQGEATSGDQSLRLTWYPRFQMFLEREQLASVLDDDQDDSSANARYTRRRSR